MAMAGRNTRASSRENKTGNLPTVGRDEVAIGFGRTIDQALQPEPSQVIGHLVGSVLGQRYAQQIRDLLPEIAIAKAVDEMMKHGERQQQRHRPRLAELQSRCLLAAFSDGSLLADKHSQAGC